MRRLLTLFHPKVGTSQSKRQPENESASDHSCSLYVLTEFQQAEFVKLHSMIHRKYGEIKDRVNSEFLEWGVATMPKLSGERFLCRDPSKESSNESFTFSGQREENELRSRVGGQSWICQQSSQTSLFCSNSQYQSLNRPTDDDLSLLNNGKTMATASSIERYDCVRS